MSERVDTVLLRDRAAFWENGRSDLPRMVHAAADELDALRAENERLRVGLLRHTDECWDYAAKTSRDSGVHWCIGACSRLRKGEITEEQYLAEMQSGKPTPGVSDDAIPETPREIQDALRFARHKHGSDDSVILCYLCEECGIDRALVRDALVAIDWPEALANFDKASAGIAAAQCSVCAPGPCKPSAHGMGPDWT